MPTALHLARLKAVTDALTPHRPSRIVDLGCGSGELLLHLQDRPWIQRLIGIDSDTKRLTQARERLQVNLLDRDSRIQIWHGEFDDPQLRLPPVDAAVMLETIEHVDVGRLPRVEALLFQRIRPALIVITTPNREYNPVHGMRPHERRHPGHRFEWTRAQFEEWAAGVATRQGYEAAFQPVGPGDPQRGGSSQMAVFQLASAPERVSPQSRPDLDGRLR